MSRRAVFDCMIFFQAAASPAGPSFGCFELVDQGLLTLCVSRPILLEVGDVLSRPQLRVRYPRLTPERVSEFLEQLESKAMMFSDVPRVFAYERDRKDEPYINLAIISGSDYLVSRDNDLLALRSNAAAGADELRRHLPNLRIVTPPELLRELRSQQPESAPGG